MVTLGVIHANLTQDTQNLLVLDKLGNDPFIHAMRYLGDGPDKNLIFMVMGDVANKRPVDLDRVH